MGMGNAGHTKSSPEPSTKSIAVRTRDHLRLRGLAKHERRTLLNEFEIVLDEALKLRDLDLETGRPKRKAS